MTLARYLASRFLRTLLFILSAFIALQILLDLIEHLRRFGDRDYRFDEILTLVALNLPSGLYELMPLVMLLAAIMMVRGLARSSELVVIRATGRSAVRALLPPVLVTLVVGALVVGVGNPLVAAMSAKYADRMDMLRGTTTALELSAQGLWLRQADGDGHAVIRAVQASPDAQQFFGVSIWRLDAAGRAHERIEAQMAEILPGQWRLNGVKSWPIAVDVNPERSARRLDGMILPTTLTRTRLIEGFGTPETVPIWQLRGFIRQLESAGLSSRAHRLWWHMELARPVFFSALVLIGAAFTMRHARAGRSGLMILGAVMSGFLLFYLRNFAQVLGENGQAPLVLAAWGPPVAGLLLATSLILMLEDG